MQTPPLPPGQPGRLPDAAAPPLEAGTGTPPPAQLAGPSTVLRDAAPRTDAAALTDNYEDVLADLFGGDDAKVSDDSPTVISKAAPKPPTEEFAADSLRGRRLAHFELLEPIGVGGMAAVIRARDAQLDRTVALKVLPPEMALDAENIRRFHQEARSAAKLDHENIARVFYCGEDQQLHFIAFEFVDGENLRMLLERRGRLPVPEALHYMVQIATGLAHAAARGVVHRDIKPSNIIISPNGRAKLVDMGLARMSETKTEEGLTHSGVTLGTFDYISPEQALEPRDADVRSDIYSLGCTFYHVLTGQAPVPEGTAAKKLHHHQHEAPVDPRQLNPEIPDDTAAILARMMAKDPKARYQRAEHLVQHLSLAARQAGPAGGDIPDRTLFVDPPLPEPPRTRPLLVAGLAAMILLIIVLFFGRTGQMPEIRDFDSRSLAKGGKEAAPKNPTVEPRPVPPVETPRPGQPEPRGEPRLIASARELLDFAREKQSDDAEIDIILTGASYDFPLAIADDVVPLPRLGGRKIAIRAKDANKKPTIRFIYDVQQLAQLAPGAAPGWLGLFLDGDDVTIENVRFVLDGRGNRDGRMAGVFLRGRDKVGTEAAVFVVKNCEFIQAGQPPDLKINRPSSVVLNSLNKAAWPRLTLDDCYFVGFEEATGDSFKNVKRGGQDAITLKTPAKVVVTNCAFGPHAALFRVESGAEGSEVAVRHCAGLLVGESAAFHVAGERTTCSFDIRHSWLAGLNAPDVLGGPWPWKGVVLLRQDGPSDRAISYQGKDNRLVRLDAFWVRPMAADPVVADDQKAFQNHDMDEESLALAANMKFWKEGDALALLERGEPSKAFQVNERLPEARTSDGKRLVGLLGWGGKTEFKPPMDDNPPVATRKVLVVDPDAKAEERAYKTLSGAIAETNSEEEVDIQLRFNGPRAMTPVVIDKRIKATIRPAAGYHPVVLVAKSRDLHSYLFRVLDGEVTLDELEFRLQPDEANLKSQAVAEMVGEGKCTFRKCVVTLDPAGKGVPVAVASISDPEAVQMRMPTPPGAGKGPRLAFENCVIRGDGDLIASHASRAFEADINHVWAALSGSFLSCDGSRDDNVTLPEPPAQLRLKQVTAYLVGHLARLRAVRDFKAMTPVQIESANCIFQAAGGKSLVHLQGPDPGEERMNTLIGWKAENNVYGGFEYLLDNESLDDKMPASPIGPKKWIDREGESHPRILKMDVLTALRAGLPLTQAAPEHFRLKADIPAGQGAMLDALPRPSSEGP